MTIEINKTLFDELQILASQSPRLRSHWNLHQSLDDPVQRLCIALKKGTYVRPHHHQSQKKHEMLVALRGSVAVLTFDNHGVMQQRFILNPTGNLSGIELDYDFYHTVIPLTDEAILLEVKLGPYTPTEFNEFASWAPDDNSCEVSAFLAWLETAQPGEKF